MNISQSPIQQIAQLELSMADVREVICFEILTRSEGTEFSIPADSQPTVPIVLVIVNPPAVVVGL